MDDNNLDIKNAKSLEKVLKEQLKQLKTNRSSGKNVSGQDFNRKSINQMGAMTRAQSKNFVPETKGIVGSLGGAIGEKIGDVKSKAISVVPGGGYIAKRLNIRKAKKKQQQLRDRIQTMYEAAFKKNKEGGNVFTTAALKSLKGSSDPGEGLIDILIQLGATTEGEIDSLFSTFGSGQFDQNILNNAIEGAAQEAGLETTSGKFGLGLKSSALGNMSSSMGSDLSPSSSSSMGPITGKSSDIIPNELEKQTKLLQSIEKYLKPDKLQSKEDKLEKDRDKKQDGLFNRNKSLSNGSGEGEGEDGGGLLASIIGGVVDAAMFLPNRRTGPKPVKPPRPPKPPRPVRIRGGKFGRLLSLGRNLGSRIPGAAQTGNLLSKGKDLATTGGSKVSGLFTKGKDLATTGGSKVSGLFTKGKDLVKNNGGSKVSGLFTKGKKAISAGIDVLKTGSGKLTVMSSSAASKVPGGAAAIANAAKVTRVAGTVLKRAGPVLAAAGAVYGGIVEGSAAWDKAKEAGDSDLSAAGQAGLGASIGALDAFNLAKIATMWGDKNSTNAFSRGLGQADDYMSVKNQMDGVFAMGDTDSLLVGARGFLSTITGGLISDNADATIASSAGNEDRRERNRKRALEARKGEHERAAANVARAEASRAERTSNENGSSNIVAPTVNSGNSSVTNTTVQSGRVSQGDNSAAMANAMARLGGFSPMRIA